MTNLHFHPFYSLKYVKYGVLLCIIPIIRALIVFDVNAAFVALSQDLIIIAAILIIAAIIWKFAYFSYSDNCLIISEGVLATRTQVINTNMIAAIEILRPLPYRIFGASKITIYFKTSAGMPSTTLHLKKQDALLLANTLMPVRSSPSFFSPTGAEKLIYVMLSANIVTGALFGYYSFNRITKIIGKNFESFAINGISEINQFLGLFLPAGLSIIFTLILLLLLISLIISLLHAAFFTVSRNGGVIISSGGLITKTERRVFAQSINYCDIKISPSSRVLRRYPVYVNVGSFNGGDMPILVYKKGNEYLLQNIIPEFTLPNKKMCDVSKKSIWQYIWLPLSLSCIVLAVMIVSIYQLPGVTPVLVFLLILSLAYLGFASYAFYKEGFCKNDNRTISVIYNRIYTTHMICIFTHDISLKMIQNPLSAMNGRCDMHIYTPCRRRILVRGAQPYETKHFKFNM